MHAAKKTLRKELKKRLSSLTEDGKTKQSRCLAEKLYLHPKYRESKRISIFLSMSDEIKTFDILENAFKSNKQVFIPKYVGEKMDMVRLRSMADYDDLPETSWHIKQPADDDVSRENAIETGGLDLILMPGLGFTEDGRRLGRGKGYYDKYIARLHEKNFEPYLLALAYSVQICDNIPCSDSDRKVDEVLTVSV